MAAVDTAVHPAPASVQPKLETRYAALDAFRGVIMILLCSRGFGFRGGQFGHVEWEGAVLWDLIQPAFMFMVGMAMPFALAIRTSRGATPSDNFRHVAVRAFKLLVLSQILMSVSSGRLHFQLINVLAQMAFTYFLCYLILQLPFRAQTITAGLILGFHWALFALFPGADGAFSRTDNIGAAIDKAVLGYNYGGHYATINFLSSTVTTLFGAWVALLLMREKSQAKVMKTLAVSAAGAFAIGLALAPFNPLVKRLWTASFTFYSTGYVLAMLLAFYWLIEVRGYRKLAWPLMVVGMNSIFIYSVSIVLYGWLDRAVGVFTRKFEFLGAAAPNAQAVAVLLVMWYLCYWLYRRKIFVKL
ncbi:MAG: hypothetical protein WD696_21385 [Bryobacteraceae bacterium]